MKKIRIVVVILAFIFIVLPLTKNMIVKNVLSGGIKAITGLGLKMEKINIGILNTVIDIKGLKLLNPANFPDALMVNMPELYVKYDLGSFFRGKAHLENLRLNLKEFIVVKNSDGILNLDSLTSVAKAKEKKSSPQKKEAKTPEIQIDFLDLKIGKVIYKDYSYGTPPKVREFNVNIDEHYENITNPYALGSLIVANALAKTAIANLANFDVGPLTDSAKGILMKTTGISGETATKVIEAGKAVGSQIKGSTEDVTGTAIETIKGLLPLGK